MTKTALVTGAASGIGRACALRLASNGMKVGVLDLNLEGAERVASEIKAAGGQAVAAGANIADRNQVRTVVAKVRETLGPITVLVNNAGVSGFVPFEDITDEQWDEQFEVNAKGTFIVTQVVLPDMKSAKWGRVINISSSSAWCGSANLVHYSASKGAVVSFTRSLALALSPLGITVNNIPPGAVMQTTMSEAQKHLFKTHPDQMKNMLPVRRTGVPEDIANACAWLASEDTGYVTGQTIGVNGGSVLS
ncbi:MAG: SDR family oxidoreductase [Rhodospirillaceae bacterium]|nr:MAG: SDR family oxidoreductase [Rhodospirillaceae bacterium]